MGDSEFVKLAVGDVFHGRYRVVRLLKEGGFGAVYEAFDLETDGRRALKVMLQNAFEDRELYDRFMGEVKIAGSIESDHVVRVYDAGLDADTKMPFMVMELLEGEELAVLAKRQAKLQRPLSWDEILDYLGQTARGLDKVHAHPKKIVHRDLKPQNLFVTRRDDDRVCIKILDFGIAKIDASDKTHTRELGTPKYMAREQMEGKRGRISSATDTYALAHVAYTLLAGEAYWTEEEKNAESNYYLLLNIMNGIVEPPVTRAKRRNKVVLPPAFDEWFLKAAALEPEDRFAKATECIAALAKVLSIPHRPTMQSEITDPSPPIPPEPPNQGGADVLPSRPEPVPRGVDTPPHGETEAKTGPTVPTKPTGNTNDGITKPSLQLPVRPWGPIAGGGLAFVGALVLAGAIWKNRQPPDDVLDAGTSHAVVTATATTPLGPSSVSQPPPSVDAGTQALPDAGAQPPPDAGVLLPADAGAGSIGSKGTPKPPPKDGGTGKPVGTSTAQATGNTATIPTPPIPTPATTVNLGTVTVQ